MESSEKLHQLMWTLNMVLGNILFKTVAVSAFCIIDMDDSEVDYKIVLTASTFSHLILEWNGSHQRIASDKRAQAVHFFPLCQKVNLVRWNRFYRARVRSLTCIVSHS